MNNYKKAFSFIKIYGIGRTLFKIFGRLRIGRSFRLSFFCSKNENVAIIGCGQFGFATIGYFISKKSKFYFLRAFDIDSERQKSFEKFYGLEGTNSVQEIFNDQKVRLVYIASNHNSHTAYATAAIKHNKLVYIEKPVSVSFDQLVRLISAVRQYKACIYAGYNRPHSKAVHDLKKWCHTPEKPLTLSCFISGHLLEPEHWYRNPDEGTRICGNVGHWLDLAVHILMWGVLPDKWKIRLVWTDENVRDDDIAITLTSERGDLISVVLTARTEPFEGINETINFQWGNTIAKIDDFRSMVIWRNTERSKYRYWPKDVGHETAILQPFSKNKRDWHEVELSSLLMLRIAEMVKDGVPFSDFSFSEQWQCLLASVDIFSSLE